MAKAKKNRGKRKGRKVGSGKFLGLPSIHERPAFVASRIVHGNWELDTIAFNTDKKQNITTCVERKSRYLIMIKNPDRKSTPLLSRLANALDKEHVACKTITCDRGSEFGHYANIQKKSSRKFYFCDPYSTWQKGTNENTNRRIRRLNNTQRKILNFRNHREDILLAAQ